MMHVINFRKRQGLTSEASQPLAQRAVPPFHVVELAAVFTHLLMRFRRQDFLIGFPEITETGAGAVFFRDAAPQTPTGLGTAIPEGKGDYLPGTPTHHRPEPAFVLTEGHKRPHFVVFEDIIGFSGQQGRFQWGLSLDFF